MKVFATNLAQFVLTSEYTYNLDSIPDLTYKCPEKQYPDFGPDPDNPVVPPVCTPCNTVESYPSKTNTIEACAICGDNK